MKMLVLCCALVVMLCFILSVPASALQVTVDLDKLTSDEAAKVLEAKKQSEGNVFTKEVSTPENLEKYADIGVKIAKAIGAAAKELSVEVNAFIQTPAGKITVALIAWEVAGKDLWGIVGGIIGWTVITAILLWSFTRFHIKERVVSGDRKAGTRIVTYVEKYTFSSNDARFTSATVHVILFVLNCLVGLIIIF